MKHPYQVAGRAAYWKHAGITASRFETTGLWVPKVPLTMDMPIVSVGSCFAQHFGAALAARGYSWVDAEPAPPAFDAARARASNYGVFSFRTGNIYTTRMLRQWLEQAFGRAPPHREAWQDDAGRFFDPMRPGIEPGGFASVAALEQARAVTYAAIRRAVKQARAMMFTLGLTESWANAETGAEYASCPGTAAGRFDPEMHVFVNHRVDAAHADLLASLKLLRAANPELKVLLSVSPVPLAATASGQHVVPATTYSKSVLRAVAGMVAEDHDWVDYVPSYEILTAPVSRGRLFEADQRSVSQAGVDLVMHSFFADQAAAFGPQTLPDTDLADDCAAMDAVCEEEMLNAFG